MPIATDKQCLKFGTLASDCSFIISHLIRQTNNESDKKTFDKLTSILDIKNDRRKPILKSTLQSDKETKLPLYHVDKKVVCFTESTLTGLKAHAAVFKCKFGISFPRDYMLKNKVNPCFYMSESLMFQGDFNDKHKLIYNIKGIPKNLHPYIIKIRNPTHVHDRYNSIHEKEWRHINDFAFDIKHLFFVFAPVKFFKKLSCIQQNGLPVLFDLNWLKYI
jgi:hypothetical protein